MRFMATYLKTDENPFWEQWNWNELSAASSSQIGMDTAFDILIVSCM